eukprot:scaffold35308_cov32-Tisochrysis_lutea.AAC.6
MPREARHGGAIGMVPEAAPAALHMLSSCNAKKTSCTALLFPVHDVADTETVRAVQATVEDDANMMRTVD